MDRQDGARGGDADRNPLSVKIVTSFPRAVREIPHLDIRLRDGTRIAARMWLPEDAERSPVPVILEYLPYRKGDGTAIDDATRHRYFAGHGFAAIRVDMRGSGDSEGLLVDEYSRTELNDAVELIGWLASQPWCNGRVGMMGISWGGFNGLQVAARRPPALKAVITICSTDDRYADDIHYMGGALLNANLGWASTMFAYMSRPPDKALLGETWRNVWMNRLENTVLLVDNWLKHQRRDAFWKHGSVVENYADIAAQGADRPLGAQVPPFRQTRTRHRVSPRHAALVGPLAEGQGYRHHGGAHAAGLDGGGDRAARPCARTAGALGGRAELALAQHHIRSPCPSSRASRRRAKPASARLDPLAPIHRADGGQLVPLRAGSRPAARPARG
jgi:pimeloyl-ACP methyl ester carboxylesterase